MIGVDEKSDVDVTVLEDLDWDVPCSLRTVELLFGLIPVSTEPACENAARWSVRCRACSAVGLSCEEHRVALIADPRSFCGVCRTKAPGGVLWEFTPYGRTS